MGYAFAHQKSMAYGVFLKLFGETEAICGKKPKIVFIISQLIIAV